MVICGTTTLLSLFALFERVQIEAPMDPLALEETTQTWVTLADPESVDAAEWSWGDGTTSPAVFEAARGKGDHIYGGPGVYFVGLTLWKNTMEVGLAEFQDIVIYERNPGKNSPTRTVRGSCPMLGVPHLVAEPQAIFWMFSGRADPHSGTHIKPCI